MGEIIQFKKEQEEEYVWECLCGCTSFMLLHSGEVECEDCKDRSQAWYVRSID